MKIMYQAVLSHIGIRVFVFTSAESLYREVMLDLIKQ